MSQQPSLLYPTYRQPEAELFRQVIDELHRALWALTFYFQGEPYINPGFPGNGAVCQRKVAMHTSTSTNAHFLDEANAEATVRMVCHASSFHSMARTRPTYEAYRKEATLSSKVIEGAERIVKWKRKLKKAFRPMWCSSSWW